MSPLIVVQTPDASAAPCGGASTMTQTPNLAIPNDGTGATATFGLSSPFGC
jgi:hypothetical protein